MSMYTPPHPGHSIRDACLAPLGLTVTEAARILGVTRPTLSSVVNGKAAVSPEMALRLSMAFGGRAETWLKMQMAYDMARLRKKAARIRVARVDDSRPHA